MLVKNQLQEVQAEIEKFIEKDCLNGFPENLKDAAQYIMSIKGKRLRPVMVLLAHEAFGGDYKNAISAAVATELFHNYTLVHDDIMDEAPIRRGEKAVHIVYGENKAIIAGDAMMLHTYNLLLAQFPEKAIDLMKCFNKMGLEVMKGQQMDMDFETREEVALEEYLEMIAFKTSVLFGAAFQIGAITAGANEADQKALYDFGLNLGLSFQIMDDYLDTFGDPATFGKKVGGDIAQNKKTFLMIHALKKADDKQREAMVKAFEMEDEAEKIAFFKAQYEALNIPALCEKQMDDFYNVAITALDSSSLSYEQKEGLYALANKILKRQH